MAINNEYAIPKYDEVYGMVAANSLIISGNTQPQPFSSYLIPTNNYLITKNIHPSFSEGVESVHTYIIGNGLSSLYYDTIVAQVNFENIKRARKIIVDVMPTCNRLILDITTGSTSLSDNEKDITFNFHNIYKYGEDEAETVIHSTKFIFPEGLSAYKKIEVLNIKQNGEAILTFCSTDLVKGTTV